MITMEIIVNNLKDGMGKIQNLIAAVMSNK